MSYDRNACPKGNYYNYTMKNFCLLVNTGKIETWRQQYAMRNFDCSHKDCIFYCIDIDARRTFNELLNIVNLPPLKLVSNYRSYQIFQIIVSFVSLSEWILLKLQTRDKRGGAARSAKSMIWIDYLKVQDRVSKVIASFF